MNNKPGKQNRNNKQRDGCAYYLQYPQAGYGVFIGGIKAHNIGKGFSVINNPDNARREEAEQDECENCTRY